MSSNNETSASRFKGSLRYILITALSVASVSAFGSMYSIFNHGIYTGDSWFCFQPISLGVFIATFILLNRYLNKEILSNKGRVILSVILGILLSIATIFSTLIIYGENNSIFSSSLYKAHLLLPVMLGLAFFYIPIVSELVGLCDRAMPLTFARDTDEKRYFYEKNSLIYFIYVWAITFLSFVPLFLYSYPINFICDAGYQIRDYMTDTLSTHHPILHSVFMGFFYNLGYKHGNPSSGLVFYTLIQMLTLSASFAYFMLYVHGKKVSRGFRVVLLLVFILNPLNSFFSISTVKGVMCAAFFMFALTFLMQFFDGTKQVLTGILFVISSILSCFFRNNMVYALFFAGIVCIFLHVKKKNKLLIFLMTVSICICYFLGNKALMKVTHAPDADGSRESMSVPLMCLARAVIVHDDMDPVLRDEILTYIDEESLSGYVMIISDYIKNSANEELLKSQKVNFLKLFVKTGLKYPGDYVEAVCGLTLGYFIPLHAPEYLFGGNGLYVAGIPYDLPIPEVSNKLPVGGKIFEFLYGSSDGRYKIPVLSILWRCPTYFWAYAFAFSYMIYRRKRNSLCTFIFPIMYMLSCFLGPVSYIRYIYINIAALPVAIYLMFINDKQGPSSAKE